MRRTVAIGATVALALLLSFVSGRYTAPTKIETREKVVTRTVETNAKEKVEAVSNAHQTDTRTIVRWRVHTVRHRDGTVESTAERDSGSSAITSDKRDESKREAEIRFVDREVAVEKIKLVESAKPGWAIAARAGLGGGSRSGIYGAEAARRLLGAVWLGAYATTAKEAGITLRVEF